MPRAWRIVKKTFADHAFDGEGARLYGSRWTSAGHTVSFAAESLSLAVLEVLVHLQSSVPLADYVVFNVSFPEDLIEDLDRSDLPSNWRDSPAPPQLPAIGDAWVRRGSSLVLRVPSVIVPHEHNFVINPAHPRLDQLIIQGPESFVRRFPRVQVTATTAIRISPGRLEAIFLQDGLPFRSQDELRERLGISLPRGIGDDAQRLHDRIIEARIDLDRTDLGNIRNRAADQAPLRHLPSAHTEGLPDRFRQDDLRLERIPQPGPLEGLLAGPAIGCGLGIGQRDLLHLGSGQVGERSDVIPQLAVDRQDQRSACIGMYRLRPDEASIGEVPYECLVRRQEYIVGRPLLDLLREQSR